MINWPSDTADGVVLLASSLLFTLVSNEPAALPASWSVNGVPPELKPPRWLST